MKIHDILTETEFSHIRRQFAKLIDSHFFRRHSLVSATSTELWQKGKEIQSCFDYGINEGFGWYSVLNRKNKYWKNNQTHFIDSKENENKKIPLGTKKKILNTLFDEDRTSRENGTTINHMIGFPKSGDGLTNIIFADYDFHDTKEQLSDVDSMLRENGFLVLFSSRQGLHAWKFLNNTCTTDDARAYLQTLPFKERLDTHPFSNAHQPMPCIFAKNKAGSLAKENLWRMSQFFSGPVLHDAPASSPVIYNNLLVDEFPATVPPPSVPSLRDGLRISISEALQRISGAATLSPVIYNNLLVDIQIPEGHWHEQMRLTGRSYRMNLETVEEDVRQLSPNCSENTIKDRIRKTKGDILYHQKNKTQKNNEDVLSVLEEAVIQACPENRKTKAEALRQRRVLVGTVAFLIAYRMRKGGDRVYLTYEAIKQAIEWEGENIELHDNVMRFVYKIIDRADEKLFKAGNKRQQKGMNIYLKNEFAIRIIEAMEPIKVEDDITEEDRVLIVLNCLWWEDNDEFQTAEAPVVWQWRVPNKSAA